MGKTTQKFTENEQKALELVKQNPAASNYKISRDLEELGYTSGDTYLTQRILKNNELASEVAIVRERNYQKLQQDITPHALTVLEDAVTSDKISKQNKFKWVKLALDKSFGDTESKHPTSPAQVNVDTIQVYINQRSQEQDDSDESIAIDSQERIIDVDEVQTGNDEAEWGRINRVASDNKLYVNCNYRAKVSEIVK